MADLHQARIDAAAAEWLARRAEGTSPADDEEFYRWLSSDDRHGDAFDELSGVLEDVGRVEGLQHLAGPPVANRRIWWAGTGIAASIAALFILAGPDGTPTQTYRTGVGQVRAVTLADGSMVALGARARISVALASDRRTLTLEEGEAFFDIAHDAARPFVITAGGAQVTVVGTKFEIRRGIDGTSVAVQEGRVAVQDNQAITLRPAPKRILRPGQKTVVGVRRTYLAVEAPLPPLQTLAQGQVAAWRNGRLIYDDVSLADVVDDLNRYYQPGVRLADDAAGEQRVTASFRVVEIPNFLTAMAETMPISVRRGADRSFVLTARTTPD